MTSPADATERLFFDALFQFSSFNEALFTQRLHDYVQQCPDKAISGLAGCAYLVLRNRIDDPVAQPSLLCMVQHYPNFLSADLLSFALVQGIEADMALYRLKGVESTLSKTFSDLTMGHETLSIRNKPLEDRCHLISQLVAQAPVDILAPTLNILTASLGKSYSTLLTQTTLLHALESRISQTAKPASSFKPS